MVRRGKKRVRVSKVPIGLRVHPEILAIFRNEADRRRTGYQTLIQDVLNEAAIAWEERERQEAS